MTMLEVKVPYHGIEVCQNVKSVKKNHEPI